MNVRVWLRGLGLGRFEEKFRENKIDFDVLADLTDGDLQELGVPLGDRRRLLTAIAEFGAQQPLTTQARRTPSAPAPARSLVQLDSAERRHLTVMFCDLVGSTELAAALDVEDWRNLISAYLDAASEAVTLMGGRVVKTLGDGLMALFGHPVAQENDSERAVRAALAIQRALAELNRKNAGSGRPALVAHIGVESGVVVVDAAGEIFGDAPNVAARVQGCAEPGAVIVTARVVIAHHFTQAGLDQLAIEWWSKAGDQALRRSAFQEAIAHLGKAIAMADKEEEEASGAPTAADRRLKLQTNYRQAVMWSKGFLADETKAAFGRAAELATQTGSNAERSAVFHALWVRSFMRAEMSSARASAESFLRQAETDGLKTEDAVAHLALGLTCLYLGEL
ncbi:MAG TPA: adenylate/guanylate cyclase domain-containing protein, partial [Roseiarcus sp.]|nr:adenylate/guanylate cyclase domain-containing protein [Roseiarcus sp.]